MIREIEGMMLVASFSYIINVFSRASIEPQSSCSRFATQKWSVAYNDMEAIHTMNVQCG